MDVSPSLEREPRALAAAEQGCSFWSVDLRRAGNDPPDRIEAIAT